MKLNRKQIRSLIQEYLPRRIPAETEQQRSAMSRGDQDGMGNRYMDAEEYYDGALRRALQDARQAAQSGNVENMKSAHSYLGHLHGKMISLGMDPGALEAEKEKLHTAIMTANYPTRRLGAEVPGRFRMEESYGDANDPYNPKADPNLVQRDMDDDDDPIRAMGFPDYEEHSAKEPAAPAGASFDQIEDDISDLLSDAVAAGMSTKELAVAIESALSLAHSMQQGREVDFRVEITASPLPRRR